ncbi:acyltransferase domain-containing protein [Streptomyces zhihengii]
MSPRIAFVFPGQGAYVPGLLAGFPEQHPEVAHILQEVDEVAAAYGHRPVSELLLDPRAPRIEELLEQSPEALHLCIFSLSLAGAAVCAAEGIRADVLVGHSFGEWAALTLAGVWTPSEAARLICERDRICRHAGTRPGGLLAVAFGPARARHLAAVADDWAVNVAVVNGPGQCVLAGPDAALDDAARAADALGVRAVRIKAAYPYHSPWMREPAREFEEVMRGVQAREPRCRVYSPVAGGFVESIDDVRRIGSGHMVVPVDFLSALHALEGNGVGVFVECGGKDIVTRLASEALRGAVTAAPLARRAGPEAVRAALAPVASLTAAAPAGRDVGTAALLPATTRSDAAMASVGSDGAGAGRSRHPHDSAPRPGAAPETAPQASTSEGGADAAASSPQKTSDAPPSHGTASGRGSSSGRDDMPPRDELVEVLRAEYAERLGYPPDVVTADADLEADLGVDSLRQTEMLTSLYTRYGIEPPAEADPLRGQTVSDIADLLLEPAAHTAARTA